MNQLYPDYRGTSIYELINPEVEHVAANYMELPFEIQDEDVHAITQRICEERPEDAKDFWVYLTDVKNMTPEDDWSDVNGCIETMIEKHFKEKENERGEVQHGK